MKGQLIAKIGKLTPINPTQFHCIDLNLQNLIDNKWTNFKISVEEMTKKSFKRSLVDKKNEYLVGKDSHMLYVEKVMNGGQSLLCMNSAGDCDSLNPSRPTIFPDLCPDKDIALFDIKLHEQCMYKNFVDRFCFSLRI